MEHLSIVALPDFSSVYWYCSWNDHSGFAAATIADSGYFRYCPEKIFSPWFFIVLSLVIPKRLIDRAPSYSRLIFIHLWCSFHASFRVFEFPMMLKSRWVQVIAAGGCLLLPLESIPERSGFEALRGSRR